MENVFKTNGVALMCNVCDKNISSGRKSQVDQHVKTVLHKDRVKKFVSRTQQLFLSEMNTEKPKEEFNHELTKAFLAADIPLWKLENECFKTFFQDLDRTEYPIRLINTQSSSQKMLHRGIGFHSK